MFSEALKHYVSVGSETHISHSYSQKSTEYEGTEITESRHERQCSAVFDRYKFLLNSSASL